MQILFAISVLSFFGIVWAALAFARHIKAGQLRNRTESLSVVPARQDFKHHLLNAPVSNSPAISAPVFNAPVVNAPAFNAPVPVMPVSVMHRIQTAPTRTTFIPEIAPVLRSRGMELRQSAKDITARKQWSMPTQSARPQRRTWLARTAQTEPAKSLALRKPPLPTRHGTMERLDPAYFNKDLGDLTDPYQPTPVRVNERRPSSSRKY